MNRIIGILVVLLLATSLQSLNAQPFAEIQFVKMDHNFGKIKEEAGAADFNFNFTNTGKIPLIIQGVEASCGCTTPEWSQEPVLPGKTGFIKVSYNPEQRPGAFAKSITVMANIPKTVRVLTISGEVVPKALNTKDLYPVDFGKSTELQIAPRKLFFSLAGMRKPNPSKGLPTSFLSYAIYRTRTGG